MRTETESTCIGVGKHNPFLEMMGFQVSDPPFFLRRTDVKMEMQPCEDASPIKKG